MSETNASEKLDRLDHRHTQLLDELDTLNLRLEETLNQFSPTQQSEGATGN